MSYHSAGLWDDMIELPAITGVGPGYSTGGRKFLLSKPGENDRRGNGGNTKANDLKLLRAYCKAGGRRDDINRFLSEEEALHQTSVGQRFEKWIKRFHIWVAHAWMRKKDRVKAPRTIGQENRINRLTVFYKNEERIVEWIELLHENPVGNCKKCKGTGLVTKPSGDFLWSYCTCSRGKLRKNCFRSAKDWDKASRTFKNG